MSQTHSKSLHFAFQQIPEGGFEIHFEEDFSDLVLGAFDNDQANLSELKKTFSQPVVGRATVVKVASKVDIKGGFKTRISGICDRCMMPVEKDISGPLEFFLMPQSQFSKHDKPGGKVIHGSTKDLKPSRHRSSSKSKVLTDAEGEHEDVSFGAFDGKVVDLRPLLREELILALPMRFLCSAECKGLCLECGQNLNLGLCAPGCSSVGIEVLEDRPKASALSHVLEPLKP